MIVCDYCKEELLEHPRKKYEVSLMEWTYQDESQESGSGDPALNLDVCKDCFKKLQNLLTEQRIK